MKRGLNRISYLVVLMAMVLFMSTRLIPHHHCSASDQRIAHSVHFGYDKCGCCDKCCHDNAHDCEHSHSAQQCCNDSQFYLRIYDDDNSFVKNILNSQPAIILSAIVILNQPQIKETFFYDHGKPPLIRAVVCHALRAPPVA